MRTLDDAAHFWSGGTPSKKNSNFWEGNIPWYSASNMDNRFLGTTDVKISEDGLNAGSRLAPQGSTLLLVRGSGLFNYVPICFAERPVAFNQDVKAIVPKEGYDPIFLHFWIESLREILNENIGVTGIGAGKFELNFLKTLPFPDFDEDTQKRLGKTSACFDLKILNCKKQNAILEDMARSIFRAWFVDFEPVHAKAAGATSFRGMPQGLFDKLKTQLNEVAEGKFYPSSWAPCVLEKLIDINPTRALKKGVLAPYVGMADVPLKGPAIETRVYREFTSGMRFQNGDTLLARITPCLENGKTALVDILAENEIGWGSTEFIVLSPTDTVGPEFIYCLARDETFRDYAIRNMTGTSGRQRVSSDAIASFPMFKAPDEYYKAFGEFARPLFSKISANRDQISVLSQLRDTLLPKLISGEIDVPDLEALTDGG